MVGQSAITFMEGSRMSKLPQIPIREPCSWSACEGAQIELPLGCRVEMVWWRCTSECGDCSRKCGTRQLLVWVLLAAAAVPTHSSPLGSEQVTRVALAGSPWVRLPCCSSCVCGSKVGGPVQKSSTRASTSLTDRTLTCGQPEPHPDEFLRCWCSVLISCRA
jgi:hypothetical protein